jgi:hypothetical protein
MANEGPPKKDSPKGESADLESAGLEEWFAALPLEDASELVELGAGDPVELVPGRGLVRKTA